MNINTLLPIISNAVGRDLSIELNMFYRIRAAIGASLTPEGQEYFINNWRSVVSFMETPEGKKATATFLDTWVQSSAPPKMTKIEE